MENTAKRKVLILTYYWPPSGGAGVQRWLKFAKYLPNFDVEPIILTVSAKHASYPQTDESLIDDIDPNLKVFKTKSFEPLNILSKLLGKKNVPFGGFTNVNKKSFVQTILRFIRGNFFIPDARKGWNKHAYKKAKEIIVNYNIDTVITTSPPHSTQLIGLKLKKNLNITWIADFRDPWTDIYYYKDLLHTNFAKRIDQKKERKVLHNADKVITVGDSLRKKLNQKLNQDKCIVISNGFDEGDFTDIKHERPEVFTITYTGTLSDQYNINSFIKACKILKSEEKIFKVRFIGNISLAQLDLFKDAGLINNVEVISYLPHLESIKYLQRSSILLLAIPDFQGNNEIVTGKIFEYLGSNTSILGIGPKDGDAAKILRNSGLGEMFDYSETENIYKYLLGLFDCNVPIKTTEEKILKYSRRNLAKQVKDLL